MKFDRTPRRSAIAIALGLAAASFAPRGHAAPISEQGQRVINKVHQLFDAKVSSPGGKMTFKLVPGAHPEKGEFREIYANGAPAKLRKLQITAFTIRARNVRINVHELLNRDNLETLSAQTSLRAIVTANDLTRYLAVGKHTKDMKLQVSFRGKALFVTGNFKWQWFSGPVQGLGRMRLGSNRKVYFDIVTLKLNGSEVPDWLKSKFSEKINPVIDYDNVPFQPKFKSLQISGDRAILSA